MPAPIRRISSDPFFTPEVVLRGLYHAERTELRAVREMAITPRSRELLDATLRDIRDKYAARVAEHKLAWGTIPAFDRAPDVLRERRAAA